ncbi:TIGR04222 domain-containing membrane protein [Motilibacter aurantiacus]|uniref:TIGR04222 domain-containing membrane protein n=1 Tax=Motilibacter aurantiacus TaxID=2714955 RepID=UPI0014074F79|nr:TIGR04222 domain-containing membrane protein [Motilibacter aurantiacus]NHC46804.1 TIGR04222 domain-containing membrane protein [Motilibacter aurantiacus]
MAETQELGSYEAAYVAGGPRRVVDTAVAALVLRGDVRARTTGELDPVDPRPRHDVEAALVDALDLAPGRRVEQLWWDVALDERVAGLAGRLCRDGLLRRSLRRPPGPQAAYVPTWTGRGALRRLSRTGTFPSNDPATAPWLVALGGASCLPDAELREAVFGARSGAGRVVENVHLGPVGVDGEHPGTLLKRVRVDLRAVPDHQMITVRRDGKIERTKAFGPWNASWCCTRDQGHHTGGQPGVGPGGIARVRHRRRVGVRPRRQPLRS